MGWTATCQHKSNICMHKTAMNTQVFQSVHFPTNAIHDTVSTTQFMIQYPQHMQKLLHVLAAGSYYDKGVWSDLLIYVLF